MKEDKIRLTYKNTVHQMLEPLTIKEDFTMNGDNSEVMYIVDCRRGVTVPTHCLGCGKQLNNWVELDANFCHVECKERYREHHPEYVEIGVFDRPSFLSMEDSRLIAQQFGVASPVDFPRVRIPMKWNAKKKRMIEY